MAGYKGKKRLSEASAKQLYKAGPKSTGPSSRAKVTGSGGTGGKATQMAGSGGSRRGGARADTSLKGRLTRAGKNAGKKTQKQINAAKNNLRKAWAALRGNKK